VTVTCCAANECVCMLSSKHENLVFVVKADLLLSIPK